MGERLVEFYARAAEAAGLMGKIRLAVLTNLPSQQAAEAPDSAENIALFSRCLDEVIDAFGDLSSTEVAPREGEGQVVHPSSNARTAQRLRDHIQVYLRLTSQRDLFLAPDRMITRAMEGITEALAVSRASVWRLVDDGTALRCVDLYDVSTGRHEGGVVLRERDNPAYFTALRTARTIAANDARSDPRTAAFTAGYLAPLGITSLLDVPIRVHGALIGAICHEHTGPARAWNADEETFGYLMANLIGLSLELSGGDASR